MLISWQALATLFASLPALAAVAYLYETGSKGQKPTFGGYVRLVLFLNKAKKEAYEKTAQIFVGSSSQVAKRAFVGLIMLILFLVGSDLRLVVATYVLCLLALPFAYRAGKRGRGSGS